MKKYIGITGLLIFGVVAFVLSDDNAKLAVQQVKGVVLTKSTPTIDREGTTLLTRVLPTEGYKRINNPKESFAEYLQTYKLKPYGSPIINYDGSHYFAQDWHEGILELPVPDNGLQQCADALMRIRSEYLWNQDRKKEIGFNFTSGHYCSWQKYAEGYRPKINGNKVSFHKTKKANHSKENFYRYLNLIYMYAGTLSLYHELEKVAIKDLQIGDMLVTPGSPGHIVIIADAIVNAQGAKRYLLVQGNTPAQSVCILKNFEDTAISPWYEFMTKDAPVLTPGYHFEKAQFLRFVD